MPWDLDRLTYWQLHSACRAAEQIVKASKEAGRAGKG